jgi:hypothetical protein
LIKSRPRTLDQGALKDYKSDLKSKNSVEKVISELLRSYQKDKARGKADSITDRLEACGIVAPKEETLAEILKTALKPKSA